MVLPRRYHGITRQTTPNSQRKSAGTRGCEGLAVVYAEGDLDAGVRHITEPFSNDSQVFAKLTNRANI